VTALRTYRLHGLSISSPVRLAAAETGSAPDVYVTVDRTRSAPSVRGRVLADFKSPHGHRLTVTEAATGWHISLPPGVEVIADIPLRSLLIFARPDVDERLIEVLLAGPVAVAVAVLRGGTVLHASAVVRRGLGGYTVAFAGPAGSGKSTLALLLSRMGGALLSDDALCVDTAPHGVLAHSGTTASRMRHGETPLDGATEVSESVDGRWVHPGVPVGGATADLSVIALPRLSATVEEARSSRLGKTVSLAVLDGMNALPGSLHARLRRQHFEGCAHTIGSVPVVLLDVPWASDLDSAQVARSVDLALRSVVDAGEDA